MDSNTVPVTESLEAVFVFRQELLAPVVLAINIEHGLPVKLLRAQLLAVQVSQVGDDPLTVQQRVQETAEQLLVHLRAEQLLEGKVGIEIDVSLVYSFQCHNPC